MIPAFTFIVPGTPRPQPRPRFVKGRVVSTADPKAKLWRLVVDRAVRAAVAASGRGVPMFTGPVRLSAVFTFAPKRGNEHLLDLPHTIRPDGDNICKLVMDVMEGAGVFKNDSQVIALQPEKWWGERPGVVVLVEDASEERRIEPFNPEGGEAPGWLIAN